jgi:hypothetical protein
MKRIILFLAVIIPLFSSLETIAGGWGCTVWGNGKVVKKTRAVRSFDAVNASSGVNVYLFHGDEEKVVVETDQNLQECIRTEVRGSTLHCYFDCSVRKSTKANIYVNFKSLNKVNASSGSDVYGETVIKSENFRVDASSGSDVKLELDAGSVNANCSSGSDIVLKGKARHFDGNASSGSDIKAAGLTVETAKAIASSAGDIEIWVSDKIDANASSGGAITLHGNPIKQNVNSSSGGKVRQR